MSKTTIPSGYRMPLSNNELQRAIELIHQEFQHSLCVRLNLHRVSAPLFVDGKTGLNDDLNGVERPVSFDIPDVGTDGQVVHSLAKWKRLALKRYEFPAGTGLYTNMNAIRRDETALSLVQCLGLAARLLVFLLLPLLIAAALTEAYVTPLAVGLFL